MFTSNRNPILDTWTYEVEFSNGHKQEILSNVIEYNMFALIDKEGHIHLLLYYIIDSSKFGDAVRTEDACIQSHNGMIRNK